jgi:hypothetical protein
VTSNQKGFSQANVCSEQEFEKLLRRSEKHCKLLPSSAPHAEASKSNTLKIVPPAQRRRDSAA